MNNANINKYKYNPNLRNTTKLKDKLREKEINSKNNGDLLENLTKTLMTKKEQNIISQIVWVNPYLISTHQ